MEKAPKIILGIDPGTLLMGYCIVSTSGNALTMVEMDVLKLQPKLDNYARLEIIYNKVTDLIRLFRPHSFAIEAPFFGKNVQSMLKLGRAQGVAIAAAIGAGLEVREYSPRTIKQSITGNGNAGKEQVWKMLQHLLQLQATTLRYYDASDALAVALCHHYQGNAPVTQAAGKKGGGWKDFVLKNPERIK